MLSSPCFAFLAIPGTSESVSLSPILICSVLVIFTGILPDKATG